LQSGDFSTQQCAFLQSIAENATMADNFGVGGWVRIIDTQVANWSGVDNSQNTNWQNINNTQ
jgi:hypothetical protein